MMLGRVFDFYHQKVTGSFVCGSLRCCRGECLDDPAIKGSDRVSLCCGIRQERRGRTLSDRLQVCFLYLV